MSTRDKLLATVAALWVVGVGIILAVLNSESMKVRDYPEGFDYRTDDLSNYEMVVDTSRLWVTLAIFTGVMAVLAVLATVWTQPKRP